MINGYLLSIHGYDQCLQYACWFISIAFKKVDFNEKENALTIEDFKENKIALIEPYCTAH
jgi:hypothetical protein